MSSPLVTAVPTKDGIVAVITNKRWCGFFKKPHTSVAPHQVGYMGKLSVVVFWSCSEDAMLEDLHKAMVRLVEEMGLNELYEVSKWRGPEAVLFWLKALGPELAKNIKQIM